MTGDQSADGASHWTRCNYCGHRWGPIHFIVHWPQHFSKRYREWYDGE